MVLNRVVCGLHGTCMVVSRVGVGYGGTLDEIRETAFVLTFQKGFIPM